MTDRVPRHRACTQNRSHFAAGKNMHGSWGTCGHDIPRLRSNHRLLPGRTHRTFIHEQENNNSNDNSNSNNNNYYYNTTYKASQKKWQSLLRGHLMMLNATWATDVSNCICNGEKRSSRGSCWLQRFCSIFLGYFWPARVNAHFPNSSQAGETLTKHLSNCAKFHWTRFCGWGGSNLNIPKRLNNRH